MLDLKKATKEELLDLLLMEAQLIEDLIKLHNETMQNDESIFTGFPERSIQVETGFWNRLVEEEIPNEIQITPDYVRKSMYNKRSFVIKLCDQDYEILNLYTNKEA